MQNSACLEKAKISDFILFRGSSKIQANHRFANFRDTYHPVITENLQNTNNHIMETINSSFLKMRKISLVFLITLFSALYAFAQPSYVKAVYNTPSQDLIEVEFSEALNWTSAGTWIVRIGGVIEPSAGPGGMGTNILTFFLPGGPITYADVVAGLTIEYLDDGDVAGGSGQLLAFGPESAINDVIIDCSMLTGVQGISVDALSGICSPVTVTIGFFWEWSSLARNSINFDDSKNRGRVLWNDPSFSSGYFALTETALGSKVFSGSASFLYPADGTECVYTPVIYPAIFSSGSQPTIICNGGSSQMTQALTNWNTDAIATGQLILAPTITQVCLGQNFSEIKNDNTLFNCRRDIEPNKPNIGPRRVQFVYGTLAGRQIPNVYVNGVQVTDAAGNSLFPGGYVEPGPVFHDYDSAGLPFPNAVTIAADHAGEAVQN